MTKKKRVPALLIAILMVFALMPASTAFAEDAPAELIDLSTAEIYVEDETYDGSTLFTPPDVTLDGELLEESEDYTYVVLDANGNEVEKYRAGKFRYKVTGIGEYTGEAISDFVTIKKATQKVTVSKTKYTKFYGNKKFKLKAKRTKGVGKLTFKSSNAKALTVNSKGVVTLKKVKKMKTVKVKIYAAGTINYKKSPVKTVTIKLYPKQKTPKAYKKYLGKWKEDDFKLYVKVVNKNYLHAVLKTTSGDYVVIKKLVNNPKKIHKFKLTSHKGKDVILYFKIYASKPYTLPNGIRMKEGPKFWCTGDSKAWFNGSYMLEGKKLYLTTYRILN